MSHQRVSLKEAASLGCRKCTKEFKTGEKTDRSHDENCPRRRGPLAKNSNHHSGQTQEAAGGECRKRITLKEAATLGCKKCTKEFETRRKTTRSHDEDCPRGRRWSSSICPVGDRAGGATTSVDELEDGDPPWRTKGNAWIGRRLQYNPEAQQEETRSCSKNRFYNELGIHEQHQSPASLYSAVKGTVVGFISERDKDSKGNPGFVSSRDGKPAMLFHVVFDKGNTMLLLNKDFEEWEIKEYCEWVYDESVSDEDGGDEDEAEVEVSNKDKEIRPKKPEKKNGVPKQTKTPAEPRTSESVASAKQSGKKVAFTQGSEESGEEAQPGDRAAADPISALAHSNLVDQNKQEKDGNNGEDMRLKNEETLESCEENAVQKSADPYLSECSSFNEALKSALLTYVSNSTIKASNNPPPPMPPPFLSHQEESTLRTALAFAMIKTRNKQKGGGTDPAAAGRSRNNTRAKQQTLSLDHVGLGKTGDLTRPQGNQNEVEDDNRESPFLGGLLSLRQRQCNIGQHINSSSVLLAFDREINHIRDIFKLAMSSILPLYRGALDFKEKTSKEDLGNDENDPGDSPDDSHNVRKDRPKRMPSAVYDFDAAYISLSAENISLVDRCYASLDGLCQHAIARLSRLFSDAALKSRLEQKVKKKRTPKCKDDASKKPTISDSCVDLGDDTSTNPHQVDDEPIQCRVVKLFYEDLIGKAYRHNPAHGDLDTSSSEKSRIEKIMAACHVIHRLLYLDQNCCFATECIIAVSRSLADLYNNSYAGVSSQSADGSTRDTDNISMENKMVQSTNKGKVQVVTPNWGTSRVSYSNDRNERRSQGIDSMCRNISTLTGIKRRNAVIDDGKASDFHQLPDVSDVLAVNLLRLLECASAIRLHHSSKRIPCQHQDRQQQSIANAESFAAAQILTEIRSINAGELATPVHMDEATAFYFRESWTLSVAKHHKKTTLLRPCAKLMLRVHFFSLVKKLSSYEQV
jgi:hypothetical protein